MVIKGFSADQFDQLEKDWRNLEKGAEMTAFQFYDWYKILNEFYFSEKKKKPFRDFVYVVAYENDKPVMIAPIQVIKVGFQIKNIGFRPGFFFIGHETYSDYINFIYDEFSENAVDEILSYLKKTYKKKYCFFEQIPEDTSLYRYIKSKYTPAEYKVYCAKLTLPKTFEEYKKTLSKSVRQNIRTAINRQNKNDIELTHTFYEECPEDIIDDLYNVRKKRLGFKRNRLRSKSSFVKRTYFWLHGVYHKHFCVSHDVLRKNVNPWVFLIKHKEEIVGYYWGIKNPYTNSYYVILAGVDTEYSWYSPSFSHLYLYFQELLSTEKYAGTVFDFTRGTERYKEDIGCVERDGYSLKFYL